MCFCAVCAFWGLFLCFGRGVFIFRASARKKLVFFGGGMSKTGNSRSVSDSELPSKTFFVLLGPNHPHPEKPIFVDVCGASFPKQGGPPGVRKRYHLESGLNKRGRATAGLFEFTYTHWKPGNNKKFWRGCPMPGPACVPPQPRPPQQHGPSGNKDLRRCPRNLAPGN